MERAPTDCAMTTWKWGLVGLIRRAAGCGSLARSGKKKKKKEEKAMKRQKEPTTGRE